MHNLESNNIIRLAPLFAGLSATNGKRLAAAAVMANVPAGTILFRQGDMLSHVGLVAEGKVEFFATWDGRETTIEVVGPLSVLGLGAAIMNHASLNSARTLGPARLLNIAVQPVRDIYEHDADFARAVARAADEHGRTLARLLMDQKLRTSMERLTNWIVRTDRAHGQRGRLEMPYEKRTLASYLGMTPENLSRNLAALKDHGATISGREIVIEDRGELQAFARPDPLIDA